MKGFDKMNNTKKLVESAVMICLASVLSLVSILKMPLGGSVTLLSMLPICIISIKYGTKHGIFTAFIYSLLQLILDISSLMSWGLTFYTWIGSILFDYIIAYTVLGLAGIFGKKSLSNILCGMLFALCLRFISHFISGTIFFAVLTPEGWNPVLYSICYNGAYMFPELLFTLLGSAIIFNLPQTSKLLR